MSHCSTENVLRDVITVLLSIRVALSCFMCGKGMKYFLTQGGKFRYEEQGTKYNQSVKRKVRKAFISSFVFVCVHLKCTNARI